MSDEENWDEESWDSWWRGDRLSPSYYLSWGPTPEDIVHWDLGAFLAFEDRTAEAALPTLLKILRDHGGEPAITLADMLDPGKKTDWALELKRKKIGAPSVRDYRVNDWIETSYFHLRRDLESKGHATPDKEALSQMSAETGLTVETIRQFLKRERAASRRSMRSFTKGGHKLGDL